MRPDLSEVGLLLTIVLAGFLAGGIHVLTGPDHLAAVAPLAAAERRRIWRAGLQWGLGHTGGVWGVAALALLTRGLLPVQLLSSWSERFVGVALIGLGLWALRRALASRVHVHEHEHDGVHHRHVHVHRHTSHHDERSHAHAHAALAFGVLHGAAGSSHFLGVLPALALPTHQAVAYLLAYGAGTIGSMSLFSTALGLLGRRAGSGTRFLHALQVGCSSAAIVVGCIWLLSATTG